MHRTYDGSKSDGIASSVIDTFIGSSGVDVINPCLRKSSKRFMPMERRQAARILLADDHRLLADACKRILEPEFVIVAIVEDGKDLMDAVSTHRPDIIVLDISMPRLNGLDAGRLVKEKYPATRLLFLSMNTSAEMVAEAFRRGASAYVPKQCTAEELLLAVRMVNRGESYLSPLIAQDTVNFLLRSKTQPKKHITARQSEILQLLAKGMTMKEAANTLDLSTRTVAFQKYRMMETLNIKTNAELLGYAIRLQGDL
jgi:DNA-binding NarL/FixJ family response regulator